MDQKTYMPLRRATSSTLVFGFSYMLIVLLLPQGYVAQVSTPSDSDPNYSNGSLSLPETDQSAEIAPRPNARRSPATTGGQQSDPDPYNSATRDPLLAPEAESEPQYDSASMIGGSPNLPIVASKLGDATGYAIFARALSTSGVNLINEQGAITIFAPSDDAFNKLLPAVQRCIFTIPARR